MDLTTNYLGLKLRSPLMPGASPMVDSLDTVRRLEDAGAGAIVMHSLFEEQVVGEQLASIYAMEMFADSYAEALSYFPHRDDFALTPDEYLLQVSRIKRSCALPVIASLNGTTSGGWLRYAAMIEEAGANALELNIYHVPTDAVETGRSVEARVTEVLAQVKGSVSIPVAVKLSPYYSSLPNLATELEFAGANGLVLFNRFYQPDIDPVELEAKPTLRYSDPTELLLRLRWLAILSPKFHGSLACSGGVHDAVGAVKALMAGANVVQLVSCLLQRGPEYLATIERELVQWMEANEYVALRQLRGCMNHRRSPDPAAFERANYMRILQSWREHAPAPTATATTETSPREADHGTDDS
jgi:dihydroorotate dehydrogenase (fumarate)